MYMYKYCPNCKKEMNAKVGKDGKCNHCKQDYFWDKIVIDGDSFLIPVSNKLLTKKGKQK